MKKIVINGRFLTVPLSGVQRTAYELTLAIDDLLDNGLIDSRKVGFTIIYSDVIVNPINLKHIKVLKKGVLRGNLWEQLELPFYSCGSLLLSMCSMSTLFKRRQVVIIHDASTFVNPQFFSRSFKNWYNFALPLLAKLSLHIITVSNFSKKDLLRFLPIHTDKITVMYNAADHIKRYGQPSNDFIKKIENLKPYCLAVSNLAENKNFRRLSQAIAQIDFKDYNMVIAGGSVNTLKTISEDEHSTYLGYVSNEELRYLYGNASVFIFPSVYEGFGIPPLEAMIMGCPVIASNTSSMPEMLSNACHYFNPLSTEDMADQISRLLADYPEMERLKQAGHKQTEKYDWQKSAFELTKLLLKYHA